MSLGWTSTFGGGTMKTSNLKSAAVGGIAGAFVAAGTVAVASTQGFVLGTTNRVDAKSTVINAKADGTVNPVDAPLLTLQNKNATANATPLALLAGAGRPPFTVNSQTRVANLNADKLDGTDSGGFLRSKGDIQLWYSPYDYAGEYLPISVTLARTDGPSVVATSSSTSNQPLVLPLDQPQSIFGRAL